MISCIKDFEQDKNPQDARMRNRQIFQVMKDHTETLIIDVQADDQN